MKNIGWIGYWIGKHSKRFRVWYWRTHEHRYIWGLYQFVQDEFEPIIIDATEEEIKMATIKEIFNSK